MRLLIALTALLLSTGPAVAAGFSFPHIKLVRGFDTTDHPQTLSIIGGVAPHARLPIGPTPQGATIRIHGNTTALNGVINFTVGGSVVLQLFVAGPFDHTFILANDTDYVQVTSGTGDTATFNALYVEVS